MYSSSTTYALEEIFATPTLVTSYSDCESCTLSGWYGHTGVCTYCVLRGVVVEVLHEYVYTVHGKVVAVLQRYPALVVRSAAATAISHRYAA